MGFNFVVGHSGMLARGRYPGYGDVKALKGKPGQHRLRVGDYRVLFALDSSSAELVVQRIAHCREVYQD